MYLLGRFVLSLTRASLAKRIGQNEKLKRQLQPHNEANVDAKAKAQADVDVDVEVDAMLWQAYKIDSKPHDTLKHSLTHTHTPTRQS